jgi:SAM-dependent methyltransferase
MRRRSIPGRNRSARSSCSDGPFDDDASEGCRSFGSATALWCLYHVEGPVDAIREAYRVLRPGGLFVTCAPSMHNDPEMAHLFAEPTPSAFDSEFAPDMVSEVFGEVEVDRWDMPAATLPDAEAVTLYLRGGRMSDETAVETAKTIEVPVTLTKRGCLVWAYKR